MASCALGLDPLPERVATRSQVHCPGTALTDEWVSWSRCQGQLPACTAWGQGPGRAASASVEPEAWGPVLRKRLQFAKSELDEKAGVCLFVCFVVVSFFSCTEQHVGS